jgi:hypothetical protein
VATNPSGCRCPGQCLPLLLDLSSGVSPTCFAGTCWAYQPRPNASGSRWSGSGRKISKRWGVPQVTGADQEGGTTAEVAAQWLRFMGGHPGPCETRITGKDQSSKSE